MTPVSAIQKYNPIVTSQNGPFNIVACMIATDILTLLLSVAIAVICKVAANPAVNLTGYLRLWPFLFVFIAVYAAVGLYSGVALSPPDELRRATWSSGLVFILLGATTVSFRGAANYFTWTLFLAMVLSIILLPLLRAISRRAFAQESWWGYPAVIFGSGPAARRVVEALLAEPEIGLKPIVVVNETADCPHSIHGVPVIGGFDIGSVLLGWEKSAYAVVPLPEIQSADFLSLIERPDFRFSRVLVIPDLLEFSSLWVNPKSVGGMLGLEVCQQIFDPGRQWAKRILDLALILMGSIVCIPLCILVALWVKWDSPGPVFYSQRRIGFGGEEFRAWKFRSMIRDADGVLQEYLAGNPELREEWERDHKLRNDPRLTRAGRFLRRTSLDELPQLWNVWKGEMSLVGPRPIVYAEVSRYGASFGLYTKVKGGITGLWQVSGRTDTTYDQRVQLDKFYVRNWSVWLDLCILFRTIGIVFIGKGAY
jgi:Undecaprenyl-phosphate galactose phosphotransferase WbaP